MKRITLLIITILSLCWGCLAQVPAGYYNSAIGLSGKNLKSTIHDIIDDHTVISYDGLWAAFRKTDVRGDGKVWDMYSECNFNFGTAQCGNYSKICDCYNREHSFPKSWFSDAKPMYSDLFHLYPTDGKVNGYRSNYPFGECTNGTVYGNGRLGTCTYPGYTGTVFEPSDEYKGDFARAYFYMLTRYMDVCKSWSTPMMDNSGNFSTWALNMLLEWDEEDPVSQKEIDRNDVVYTDFQHNRNPFIDYPELARKIFGSDSSPFNPSGGVVEDFFEDFEGGVKDSYVNGNVVLSTGEWIFNGAAIGTAEGDKKFGVKCAKLRLNGGTSGSTGENGYIEMVTPKMGGVGMVSLYHATFGLTPVDPNSKWKLQVSQNGGEFVDVGGEHTSSPELREIVIEVRMGGSIRIRIVKTDGTNSRLNIDNIRMTDYEQSIPILYVDNNGIDFGDVHTNSSSERELMVSGANLTSAIGFELRGADAAYFDVTKVEGWDNMSGGSLMVKFSPMEVKHYVGELVVKSAGVDDVSVSLNGRGYVPTVPTLVTDMNDDVVDFETTVNVPVSKNIKVRGYNLTGDVVLSVTGNGSFSVTPTRISKSDAMGGDVNVVLKYEPKSEGMHSAMLKMSSAGATTLSFDVEGEAYKGEDNMVADGGFEIWDDEKEMTYWSVVKGTISKESEIITDGMHSARLNMMADSDTYYIHPRSPISVVSGTAYNISFDYYFTELTTGTGARIWGVWKDGEGNSLAESNLKPTNYLDKTEKEVWKRFEISAVAPANAVALDLQIRWYVRTELYVDNVVMTAGEVTDLPFVEVESRDYVSTVECGKTLFVGIVGRNLTPNGELGFSISGDYFTLVDNALSIDVDGRVDDELMVKYNPTTIGQHNAILSITGGGLSSAVVATITANAVKPTTPIATEATDVSDSSFTANWNVELPERYLLTVQNDSNVLITDLLIEGSNSYEVTGLKPENTYYYYVKTTTGNFSSTRSNVITVVTKSIGVEDVEDGAFLSYYKDGVLSIEMDDKNMSGNIQLIDMSGRVVMKDKIVNGEFKKGLTLPDNIYILKVNSGRSVFTNKLIIR